MRDIAIALLGTAALVLSIIVPTPAAQVSTTTLTGTVMTEAGRPLAAVSVLVFPADPNRWTPQILESSAKRRDGSSGRFEVTGLPPGAYIVQVAGVSAKQFPDVALLKQLKGPPITLSPGQPISVDLVVAASGEEARLVTMTTTGTEIRRAGESTVPAGRGQPLPPRPTAPGSISGRLTDEKGQPIAGAEIHSLRPIQRNGEMQLASFGMASTTAEDGTYRLANRTAGTYLVAAFPYGRGTAATQFYSERRAPAGHVLTFYPGVTREREGTLVTVGTAEVSGIDFRMATRPVYTVTGRVEGSQRTAGEALTVLPAVTRDQMLSTNTRRVRLAPDGSFAVQDLTDGRYVLSMSSPSGWAAETIEINGAAPDPVVVRLRPLVSVSGTIEYVGTSPRPTTGPAQRAGIRPERYAELVAEVLIPGTAAFPTVLTGETFSTHGTGPGPLVLRAGTSAPWVQVSGFINGVDTLDLPFSIETAVTDARIVFTDKLTTFVAVVRNADETPASGATVVLFSEDARYWVRPSRRAQVVPSSSVGTATFQGLPPGRYLIAAVRDVPPTTPPSAALFSGMRARALPLELAAGESRSVTLTVR